MLHHDLPHSGLFGVPDEGLPTYLVNLDWRREPPAGASSCAPPPSSAMTYYLPSSPAPSRALHPHLQFRSNSPAPSDMRREQEASLGQSLSPHPAACVVGRRSAWARCPSSSIDERGERDVLNMTYRLQGGARLFVHTWRSCCLPCLAGPARDGTISKALAGKGSFGRSERACFWWVRLPSAAPPN